MKVLLLPKWYPNRYDELDGIFVVEHAKAIARFAEVYVLFLHSDPDLRQRTKSQTTTTGNRTEQTIYFRYRRTGISWLDRLQVGCLYLFHQFGAYRKLKRNWGVPDVTHVHVLLRPAILSLFLKWFRRIPFLVTEHWSGYDPAVGYSIHPLKKRLLTFVLHRAARVTAVSEYAKHHLQSLAPKATITVIPNAVDETLFRPAGKTQRSKKQLIHVSTLDDYPKNFGQILRAMHDLKNERDDFELLVIGKGKEREKQEKRADGLGLLNTVVFFLGYLEKEHVANYLADSDFMILFSHYETQSCVVLEALLSGIPVIVPAVGGVQELVNAHNGIIVDPFCNNQLVAACRKLLDEAASMDSALIRSNAMRYSATAVAEQFKKVIAEVISSQ